MKKSKYFLLAVVCLLLTGFAADAQAQKQKVLHAGAVQGQSGPTGMATVNALQVSSGELGFHYRVQSDTNFGLSFFGQTSGDFPGTLTLSLNATTGVGTGTGPSASSINGGTWTLPVYQTDSGGRFVGALYGTISQGDIVPTENPDKSRVFMTFEIQGGTLAYQGATGRATFSGTLTTDVRSNTSELEGTVVFNAPTD
jgi:hypothetical protein